MTSDRPALPSRYRLIRKLGSGGMGSVWLAEDRQLERLVAVKQLMHHTDGENRDERRQRALREAVAMARVRHPSIVGIHDVLDVHGDPWIVMEYIEGRSLDVIIEATYKAGRRLEETAIAAIGLPVLRGLSAAHEARVVHRDVKPANIVVADDDSVFLVDFGIAKIAGDRSLTGQQKVMGTLEFLAPERLANEEVGAPADLWSLGVTLFYALEGYSPFRPNGEMSTEAIVSAILSADPPRPVRAGRLADVILGLLRKDPRQRAGAAELTTVLESIPGAGNAGARPARPQPARPGGQVWPPAPDRVGAVLRDQAVGTGTDARVALLLALSAEQAAQVLASYPPRMRGELLQDLAGSWPDTVAIILPMLSTTDIGRSMGHLRPQTAAAVLDAMPVEEAARILSRTGARTAAGIVMELPDKVSPALVNAMGAQQAAEMLGFVRPDTVASLLNALDGRRGKLLALLDPSFRVQVTRFL
jgi:flagellar motility protein MotE (MotC chaperone)